VATADLVLVDPSRPTPSNGTYAGAPDRNLPTKVWYPAAAVPLDGATALVASGGPFPIIVYAHGFLSSRNEAVDLKAHLASHGYIVIAPDFPLSKGGAPGGPEFGDLASQPGDLAFLLDHAAKGTGQLAFLAGGVDMTRVGLAGLSLGGATTLVAAYHPTLNIPSVRAAVAYAPVACFFGAGLYKRAIPTVVMGGSADELVPFHTITERTAAFAPSPLTVVRLAGGTHVGFMGIDIPDAGNTDQVIACGAVQGAIGANPADAGAGGLSSALGAGVLDYASCGKVCGETFLQTMRGARQLALTRIVTLAHFEAVLRGRADAARFLSERLEHDNQDVQVTIKR
jgi:predicted dienelactone hydrolase